MLAKVEGRLKGFLGSLVGTNRFFSRLFISNALLIFSRRKAFCEHRKPPCFDRKKLLAWNKYFLNLESKEINFEVFLKMGFLMFLFFFAL